MHICYRDGKYVNVIIQKFVKCSKIKTRLSRGQVSKKMFVPVV